jgi:hypothetical protein
VGQGRALPPFSAASASWGGADRLVYWALYRRRMPHGVSIHYQTPNDIAPCVPLRPHVRGSLDLLSYSDPAFQQPLSTITLAAVVTSRSQFAASFFVALVPSVIHRARAGSSSR